MGKPAIERETCAVCGRQLAAVKDGTARWHSVAGEGCLGAGKPTVETAAKNAAKPITEPVGELPDLPYGLALTCGRCGACRWTPEPHYVIGAVACPAEAGEWTPLRGSDLAIAAIEKRTLAETWTVDVFALLEDATAGAADWARWVAWGSTRTPDPRWASLLSSVINWFEAPDEARVLAAAELRRLGATSLLGAIGWGWPVEADGRQSAGASEASQPSTSEAPSLPSENGGFTAAEVSDAGSNAGTAGAPIDGPPDAGGAEEDEGRHGRDGAGGDVGSGEADAALDLEAEPREGEGRAGLTSDDEPTPGAGSLGLPPEPSASGSSPPTAMDSFNWLLQAEVTFDDAWAALEKEGRCDAIDGCEYDRVKEEWAVAGRPTATVREFINTHANIGPDVMAGWNELNAAAAPGIQPSSPVSPLGAGPGPRSAFPVIDQPLWGIRAERAMHSRAEIDAEAVAEYAAALLDGAEFPPIVVFGDDRWLAAGWHRVAAHAQVGRETIRAEVRPGGAREALLYAVGADATHGLRRTNADKRRAVTLLLQDREFSQLSNREIARRCGVSDPHVMAVRRELEEAAAAQADAANQTEAGSGPGGDDDRDPDEREERETEQIDPERQPSTPAQDEGAPEEGKRERAKFDAYYTPLAVCRAAVAWLDDNLTEEQLGGDHLLEPSVGQGNWVQAARERWEDCRVDRVDVNPAAPGLTLDVQTDTVAGDDVVIVGDWLTVVPPEGVELVLGNPPYAEGDAGDVLAFIAKCLEAAPVVALVLRETVTGDTSRPPRAPRKLEWWGAHVPAWVVKLTPRPLWEGPGAHEDPDFCDSILVVWVRGETDTRFRWLDVRPYMLEGA